MADENINKLNEGFSKLLDGQRVSNAKQERMIDLLSIIAGQTKKTQRDIEADSEPETSLMVKLFGLDRILNKAAGLYDIDDHQKDTLEHFKKLEKEQKETTTAILGDLTASINSLIETQKRTTQELFDLNDLIYENNTITNMLVGLQSEQLILQAGEADDLRDRLDEAERDRAQTISDLHSRYDERQRNRPDGSATDGGGGSGLDPKLIAGLGGGALLGGKIMSIGIGVGAALAGFGVAAGGTAFLINVMGKPGLGKNIAENTEALLDINTDNVETLAAADVAGAMLALGGGLAVFGVGGALASTGEIVNTLSQKIGGRPLAQAIAEDVEALLNINIPESGFLGTGFAGHMLEISTGLAVLSVGEFAKSISGLVTALGTKISGRPFAQAIAEDVEALLSIQVPESGFLGTGFAGHMAEISAGLLVLSVGEFASGIAGLVSTLDTTLGGKRFAEGIKEDVETLMSIKAPEGGFMGTGFAGLMTELAAGIAVFSAAEGFAGVTGLVSTLDAKLGDGRRFTEGLADDVERLLTLSDDKNRTAAYNFSSIMGNVALGLGKITAVELVDAIIGIGEGFINFFTGNESPLKAVVELAESADELDKGSDAIVRLADALTQISALKFDGKKINMREFAEDLVESVPVIEAAIMGGVIDNFGPFNTKFKGLASPDIDFDTATKNILMLRGALSDELGAMRELELSNMMSNQGATVVDSSNNQVFNTNSSTGFVIGGQAHNSDLEKYKLSTN